MVAALVAVLRCLNEQVAALEAAARGPVRHPSGRGHRAQPARAWGGAGRLGCWASSATTRTAMPPPRAARRSRAPPRSPDPRGFGTVVVARAACNQRLVDACYLWAFAALTASPGARRCYDAHRARGATHHQALRALGNRLVGILHGCLAHRVAYQEQVAWPTAEAAA